MSCSPWGHKESDMAERLNNYNFKLKSMLLCVKSFSCVWLFVSPWTVAHQCPSVHRISQAKILEQFAMSSSRGSSQPRGQTLESCVSCIARRFFFFFLIDNEISPNFKQKTQKIMFKFLKIEF